MICKHCQQRIIEVNFAMGKRWMHQHEGAAFQDGMYEYCKLSVAEPS